MKPVTFQDYKRRVLRVLVHIQEHLDEPLAMSDLARLACFSPFHFHRVFKGMLGESVQEHIRRLRLERAAGQLKLGSATVTEIAFDAGYESPEAFSRSFRVVFGTSPSVFRSRKVLAPLFDKYLSNLTKVNHFKTIPPGGKKMDVKIQHLEPIRVAFMRHTGPYAQVSGTWERFLPFLGKEGYLGGDAMLLGICHDDPEVTPPNRVRYDACVSVDEGFQPVGEIGAQVIPGGDYAITTHFGPYHKLGETYTKLLGQWLPRSGRELRFRPCFEVYLNDPQNTDPEDLLTDIYAPLRL